MKVGLIILLIGVILMAFGIGLIFYDKTRPLITIDSALSELGESGGTLYLKPGYWVSSDRCVEGVVRR